MHSCAVLLILYCSFDVCDNPLFVVYCRLVESTDQEGQRKKDPRARPRPLYDIPYMFEAREFLRKKLIGKKVTFLIRLHQYLLVTSTDAIDRLERFISEMTYYVLNETLNPTHSLTHCIVSTSAIDCLQTLISEMTCYVSTGTLNL